MDTPQFAAKEVGAAKALVRFMPRYVTSFHLLLVETDLPKGTTKVPVQVVLPAYLHRQMRNVKLHVKEGRKISGS
jgi:hypothetical protein